MMQQSSHIQRGRKQDAESMFNSISKHYDRLNHLLSLGTDRRWRYRAVRVIGDHMHPATILDVAAGTADLAIAAMKLDPLKVTGIDISERMLEIGREKISRLGLTGRMELLKGDAEHIMFPDGSFDVVMSAFGVRNFENTETGLREMFRVLRTGGMIMILEFSKPSWFPLKQIYGIYFRKLLPLIGRRVSGDRAAYSYLPDSVMSFPDNEEFLKLLKNAGFSDTGHKKLTGGIACIYYGFRR